MEKSKLLGLTALSALTLTLSLLPTQQTYAEESGVSLNSSSQSSIVQSESVVTPQGSRSYQLGQTSASIYLNGSLDVQIYTSLSSSDLYSIDIYDSNGRHVYQRDRNPSEGTSFHVSGLYGYHTVRVQSYNNNGTFTLTWP
ncbi:MULTISPECIES: T9SS type A sorting domain-containing protein [unclassified Paenibacillus]|uniref:T9SS type A sorting domain-containing protein n=1 Tax=unclassified Paenibacillus TaxID=185978 RepID=UPI001F3F7FA2|nr:T9SS type A sorting domain-containing protein [Paenibacillus sp. MZ03-122A]MCF2719959.1 T9SS type A sorting domain-containing protein [Paenibacillus sp. UKAQ_18]MCP3778245.1 T9SS type A sorting domain-containing protein [Paenibacillus sp. MZ03-122A]